MFRNGERRDFYAILGVGTDATPEEIKRAYRALCFAHHPDKNGDAEKFKEVQDAYSTLSDGTKRRTYDSHYQIIFPKKKYVPAPGTNVIRLGPWMLGTGVVRLKSPTFLSREGQPRDAPREGQPREAPREGPARPTTSTPRDPWSPRVEIRTTSTYRERPAAPTNHDPWTPREKQQRWWDRRSATAHRVRPVQQREPWSPRVDQPPLRVNKPRSAWCKVDIGVSGRMSPPMHCWSPRKPREPCAPLQAHQRPLPKSSASVSPRRHTVHPGNPAFNHKSVAELLTVRVRESPRQPSTPPAQTGPSSPSATASLLTVRTAAQEPEEELAESYSEDDLREILRVLKRPVAAEDTRDDLIRHIVKWSLHPMHRRGARPEGDMTGSHWDMLLMWMHVRFGGDRQSNMHYVRRLLKLKFADFCDIPLDGLKIMVAAAKADILHLPEDSMSASRASSEKKLSARSDGKSIIVADEVSTRTSDEAKSDDSPLADSQNGDVSTKSGEQSSTPSESTAQSEQLLSAIVPECEVPVPKDVSTEVISLGVPETPLESVVLTETGIPPNVEGLVESKGDIPFEQSVVHAKGEIPFEQSALHAKSPVESVVLSDVSEVAEDSKSSSGSERIEAPLRNEDVLSAENGSYLVARAHVDMPNSTRMPPKRATRNPSGPSLELPLLEAAQRSTTSLTSASNPSANPSTATQESRSATNLHSHHPFSTLSRPTACLRPVSLLPHHATTTSLASTIRLDYQFSQASLHSGCSNASLEEQSLLESPPSPARAREC